MFVVLLTILSLVRSQDASICSFDDASGYSLNWSSNDNNVYFNLTYRNFPPQSYTGVGFGQEKDDALDLIIVQLTGYRVQVIDASVSGARPPVVDADSSVVTSSASYRDNTLRAEFYRPIVLNSAGDRSLDGCNTWNFLTSPGRMENDQYSTVPRSSRQVMVCDVRKPCSRTGSGRGVIQNAAEMSWLRNMLNQNRDQQHNTMFSNGIDNNNNRNFDSTVSTPVAGNSFGWTRNTATTPSPAPYTGTPFVYKATTSMPPQQRMFDTNGGSTLNRNQLFTQSTQQNTMGPFNQNQNTNMNSRFNVTNFNRNENSNGNTQEFNSPNRQQQQFSYNGEAMSYPPIDQQSTSNQYGMPRYQQEPYFGSGQAFQSQYYQSQNSNQFPQRQFPVLNNDQNIIYNNDYGSNVNRINLRSTDINNRKKRQSTYQPTDNIYGYNYDSSAQGSTPLVMNPNYKYLSGSLADEYSGTYSEAVRQSDDPSANSGNLPVLSDAEQNSINYQQIQRDYAINPNPTAGNVYTNNPYGYSYDSSAGSSNSQNLPASTVSGSSSAFTVQRDSNSLFYAANPTSTTQSPFNTRQFDQNTASGNQNLPYQSASNLKQTLLRDQTPSTASVGGTTGVFRDDVSQSNYAAPPVYSYYDASTAMYYPYRTDTNFQTSNGNAGTPNNGINSVMFDSTTGRMRDGSDACSLQDPYWCDYYVTLYLTTQTQYNFSSQQMACQSLVSSLQDSYNGCCQTVRNAGCSF